MSQTTHHLGSFKQPMLLFGGSYSNLQSVEALQLVATQQGIPPGRIICTGDVVAYCAQPAENIDAIRAWGVHVLMGNCEESLAEGADDCGCGFGEGSQCDLLSAQWYNYSRQQLTDEQRQWCGALPRRMSFDFNGVTAEVVHGGLSAINRFLFASQSEEDFTQELALSDAQLVIAGHSGIPFSRKIGDRLWHNTGALGMPANDGTHRTWYTLLYKENNRLILDNRALEYDFTEANRLMRKSGLGNGYAECLKSGLWPSLDVLPEEEKSEKGIPLSPFISKLSLPQDSAI